MTSTRSCDSALMKNECYTTKLSPCSLFLPMTRCSSFLLDGYSSRCRISCGSISPICGRSSNQDMPRTSEEVRIIVTDPQNNNLFMSVVDVNKENSDFKTIDIHNKTSTPAFGYHSFYSSNNSGCKPTSRLLIIIMSITVPAFLGLGVFIMERDGVFGLGISIPLFCASAVLLLLVTAVGAVEFFERRRRLSQPTPYQIFSEDCSKNHCECDPTTPMTFKDNDLIICAEKKISRTEYFNND